MNPILIRAISAAEQVPIEGLTYEKMYEAAYESAKNDGLGDVDASVVARSAASDGQDDDPAGYKDLIPPFEQGHAVASPEQTGRWGGDHGDL